jgi:hypothetical protein
VEITEVHCRGICGARIWDLLHVTEDMGANAGTNFPVLCVAYDWVIAGYLWWWLAPRTKTS